MATNKINKVAMHTLYDGPVAAGGSVMDYGQ